jgi:hypothetical protein
MRRLTFWRPGGRQWRKGQRRSGLDDRAWCNELISFPHVIECSFKLLAFGDRGSLLAKNALASSGLEFALLGFQASDLIGP